MVATAKRDGKREAMTHVDAAWLRMDSAVNLMVINGVMLFDESIEFERILQIFCERFIGQHPRFSQRIVKSPPGTGRFFWEDDPYFDIRSHVHRIALPAPGDTATLQYLMGNLMSESLDRFRPLWRFYLIENVEGGCALFGRIHHSIADGIALIRVLLSLTDKAGEDFEIAGVGGDQPQRDRAVPSSHPLPFVGETVGSAYQSMLGLAGTLRRVGLGQVDDPGELVTAAKMTGILSATSAAILAKLLVMPSDRPSAYRKPLSAVKRIVWTDPIDLDEVKQIGRATGATVNDVLVATVAGALRRDLQAREESAGQDALHAMVPVNLRPLDGDIQLGNEFSLVYLGLPVHVEDPIGRLYDVKHKMDRLKRSPEALLVYQVLHLLGMLPGEVARLTTEWFASKASCVLTNVPGPRETIYLGGKPLRQLMFWVPQSGDIGIGISIISYAGSVVIGLMVDEGLVGNPEQITENIHKEFATLREMAQSIVNFAEI